MPVSVTRWPPSYPPIYANFASFPAKATDGALVVAADTSGIYIFSEASGTWLAVGGSAVPLVVGGFDAAAANRFGATIGSNSVYMQSATTVYPGLVSSAAQSFAGVKTFVNGLKGTLTGSVSGQLDGISYGTHVGSVTGHASLDILDSSRGTTTETASSVLTLTNWSNATIGSPFIEVKPSTGSQSGYLSATDWLRFDLKQAAISFGTTTESGSSVLTLTNWTNATQGSPFIQVKKANGSQDGYLAKEDWIKLNSTLTLGTMTETSSNVLILTGWAGATIGSPFIQVKYADEANDGALTAANWSIFNQKMPTVDTTETASSVLTLTGFTGSQSSNKTIQVLSSNGSQSGYLKNTDWVKFNQITQVSDWTSFTPHGGSFAIGSATYTGLWRRVGDSMEIKYRVQINAAVTSTSFEISLPAGYEIDLVKTVESSSSLFSIVGVGEGIVFDSGSASYPIKTVMNGTSSFILRWYKENATGVATQVVTNNAPALLAVNDRILFSANVPIVGWTSLEPR